MADVAVSRARGPSGRGGAALVTVVLLSLALFSLGHGMLTLALGELAASRAAARYLEARAAADAAVSDALASPVPVWLDSLALGEQRAASSRAWGRADGGATLRRLSRETWWVEGNGRVEVAEVRTARLAWALDPLERVASLPGMVSVGAGAPLLLAGMLDATAPTAAVPPSVPADCAPWRTALEATYLDDPLPAIATLPATDTLPRLGLLDFRSLLDEVAVSVVGTGAPAPVESLGACATTDPWNWGDPERPWRACGSHLPLRGASGDLRVDGGSGQLVLVVDGDLALGDGARLRGLVVTSGALRVEGGATLEGMALVGGGLHVATNGRIVASACWAARALAAQRTTLGRLRALPGGGPLGPI